MATKTISRAKMARWLDWMDKSVEATIAGDIVGGVVWLKETRRSMLEAALADIEVEVIAPPAAPGEVA